MSPLVSVILPVYNSAKFLTKCLDSLLAQTLKEIEIICVDDGSVDNSKAILESYQKKDARIRVLSQPNLGAGVARNNGLQYARGQYLSFLDSDDFFEPSMLEFAAQAAESNTADIVVFGVNLFDESKQKIVKDSWVIKEYQLPKVNPFSSKNAGTTFFTCVHTCAWNKLFRASFIRRYNLTFQNTQNTNDLYFVCMSMALAEKIYYISEVLMTYRINVNTSLSQSNSRSRHPDDAHEAFLHLKNNLVKYGKYAQLRKAYINLCLSVYYYNSKKLNGSSKFYYVAKLVCEWLPELELDLLPEQDYLYPHLLEFKKELGGIKLFSFDIFDTLITRDVYSAQGIFILLERELNINPLYGSLPQSLRENFTELRSSTERFLYQKCCDSVKRDITINEIYDTLGDNFSLSKEEKSRLMDLEIAFEREHFVPISQNIKLVEYLLSHKKRVALISDMYLSENVLRSFLKKFSNCFQRIKIFTSSECNAKKYDGLLFRYVKEDLHVEYREWVHFGDNSRSDFQIPTSYGINSILFDLPKLKPYELQLFTTERNDQTEKLLGALKLIDISNSNKKKQYIVGAHLGGPILWSYVSYILEQATRLSVRSLYFIARDGYILKKLCDLKIQQQGLDIETSYIFGSRLAWRDPYMGHNEERIDEIKQYLDNSIDFSKKFAFVEYAGTGVTIDCVLDMLKGKIKSYCGTFYLYLSKKPDKQFGAKFCYLPLNDDFNNMIELLARAPHGQTLHYAKSEDGKYLPILEEKEGTALRLSGYNDYINGVVDFGVMAESKQLSVKAKVVRAYIRYLNSYYVDEETVQILGSIPFVLDGAVDSVSEYAPAFKQEDLTKGLRYLREHTNNIIWSAIRSETDVRDRIFCLMNISLKNKSQYQNKNRNLCVGQVDYNLCANFKKLFNFYRNYGLKQTIIKVKRVLISKIRIAS